MAPTATERYPMATFSSLDDDSAIPSIDLCEDVINGKMKAVFAWGEEKV
jgi:hypothetical protein